MDLRANAIITAVDRFSGPMAAMSARMDSFVGRSTAIATAARRMSTSMAGGGLMSAAVLHQMAEKAEKFNQAIFGVGVASIGEAMDSMGKVDIGRPLRDMRMIEKSSMGMSSELRMSSTTISQIQETLAKAGLDADKLEAATRVTAILSKTDFETPANKMAEFMHVLSIIHKPQTGESFGDFMKRQADMINIAASETRLSVGSIMEGLRQFQPIGASMGLKSEDMIALLMAGVRSGFNPIESGTALKSSMTRAYKPTAAGMFALNSILGPMGKSLSDYTAAAAQDPRRAKASLNSSFGFVKGKFGTEIERELYTANREGYQTTDGFIQRLSRMIAKEGGQNQLSDLQRIENQVRSAILAPGKSVDVLKLWQDFVAGGGDVANFANYFEGRHLARLMPVLESLRKGKDDDSPFAADVAKLKLAKGQGLDTVEGLWGMSAFGNMKAMAAAWERILIKLANSPGIQQFVGALESMAAAIERADPAVMKVAGWAAVLTTGAAGAGLLFAGLATAVAGVAAALSSPAIVALLAAGGLAALFGAGSAFKGAEEVPGEAGAAPLLATWTRLKELFTETWGLVKDIGGTISDLMTRAAQLFGMDGSGSAFVQGLRLVDSFLKSSADSVRTLRENMQAIKDFRFTDLKMPSLMDYTPASLARRAVSALTPQKDELPPLAQYPMQMIQDIKNWAPEKVNVEGQATITSVVKVEFVNGIPQATQQGEAQQSVPLRTGQGLGDIGAP